MSLRDPMPSYIIAGAKRSLARGGAPAAGGPKEAAAAGNVPSHSHRQPSSPIKEEEEREEGRTSGGGGLRQQQQRQGARQSALLAPPPSLPGTQPPPFAMTSMPAYPSYYKRCGSYFKCSLTLRVCVCHNFLPEGLPTCTVSSIVPNFTPTRDLLFLHVPHAAPSHRRPGGWGTWMVLRRVRSSPPLPPLPPTPPPHPPPPPPLEGQQGAVEVKRGRP